MASSALEEKMKKIRLQNEKIRQRYEEVEADKKNAAKLNALVQLVPSDDWPERKEPPEFSAPSKNPQKLKPNKEHNDRHPAQHYPGIQERLSKKDHKFAQGDGPPPDPKYNFLADSEREARAAEDGKNEEEKNRSRNKTSRGPPKRRGGGAGGGGNSSGGLNQPFFKDNRGPHAFHSKGESLPEYEAWRAERDRIDEARINRQKTAEGNWRREWDCNKVNIEKEIESVRQGDSNRKDFDRRNNHFESDYSNRGHGGSRMYHGSQKNHGNQEYRRPHHEHNQSHEYKRQPDNKQLFSPIDDRMVTATDKNIKVTVNPVNQGKGPVMSVKVNSPSIAGTGRVGPRQKSRITYCSQSDADMTTHEISNSPRQKSFDEKTSGANFTSGQQKSTPKSPFAQRRKEGNPKSPYPQKKECRGDDQNARPKNPTKAPNAPRNEHRDQRPPNQHTPKQQRNQRRGAQKAMTESSKSVPSSSDNAIPSEYDPKKSFNCENFNKQTVDNENDDIENVLVEPNQSNMESSNKPKKLDEPPQIVESIVQNMCNVNIEDSNVQSNENGKIDENNENEKIIENSSNTIEIDNITKNIEEINICEEEESIKINLDEKSQNLTNENIGMNETSRNIPGDIIQNEEELKNDKILDKGEQNENKLLENKNDENTNAEEKTELVVISNELQSSISQGIKESEVKHYPVEEIEIIKLENQDQVSNVDEPKEIVQSYSTCEKKINIESQQISNNANNNLETEKIENLIENKSIESNEKESTNLDVSPKTFLNDSGIVDDNSELDKIKISELDNSQNLSANDSDLTNDFSKSQNDIDIAITEANSKTDIQNDSEIQSDPVGVTKENCEKSAEICDNSSVVSEATAQPDDRDEQVEVSDDTDAADKPENPTKDNDDKVVKADGKDFESTALKNELTNDETIVNKESSTIAAEETKTD